LRVTISLQDSRSRSIRPYRLGPESLKLRFACAAVAILRNLYRQIPHLSPRLIADKINEDFLETRTPELNARFGTRELSRNAELD